MFYTIKVIDNEKVIDERYFRTKNNAELTFRLLGDELRKLGQDRLIIYDDTDKVKRYCYSGKVDYTIITLEEVDFADD